jgi:general L-amino acid transport system substrate-binding protein
MMKRLMILALLAATILGVVAVVSAQSEKLGPVSAKIVAEDELVCGVNDTLAGFGVVNDSGEFSGFDVDFCRAIAAAILGDATKVSFRVVQAADRQAVLQGGEIDVLIRNTTWTLSRDTDWGAIFGPTTFYDGQGIGVRADLGVTTIEELEGASICVQQGTTTELNIADAISSRGLDINVVTFAGAPETWQAYLEGRCEAWTTDKSGIVSYHAQAPAGENAIMEITLSKEPLGPLSPQSDPQFAEIIAWTIYGMITAEEKGITSQNIGDFMTTEDPEIQRLLGIGDNASGSYLGIANDFMVNVITQVGNYGEVFDRNLGVPPFSLPRGLNALWTDGGILYAPPFR